MEVWVGSGLLWMWVWHKSSWKGHHQPHHRAARTYTGLGNTFLKGTNRTLCTKTQEKGTVTPQDLPVGVQESPVKAWVGGGPLQGWGMDCSSTGMGSFEGDHHYLHYLHHGLAPAK